MRCGCAEVKCKISISNFERRLMETASRVWGWGDLETTSEVPPMPAQNFGGALSLGRNTFCNTE